MKKLAEEEGGNGQPSPVGVRKVCLKVKKVVFAHCWAPKSAPRLSRPLALKPQMALFKIMAWFSKRARDPGLSLFGTNAEEINEIKDVSVSPKPQNPWAKRWVSHQHFSNHSS